MAEELIEQVGGPEVVAELVREMYARVLQDAELSPFFEKVDQERLSRMQYEFLVSALGGPVQYTGAELSAIHAGRGITAAHFARFVGHMADAMEDRGIEPQIIDKMLGHLAMYRDKIIGSATVDG